MTQNSLILAPTYTQIPNELFDHWMHILTPGAFKVVMCIARKTFGWHKTSDTISKNQLIKATGMSKNSIQTFIEELESYKILLKFQNTNEYGCQPNTYSLNIKKPEDLLYQDETTPHQKKWGGRSNPDQPGERGGSNFDRGVGQTLTPQKKDLTKETTTTLEKSSSSSFSENDLNDLIERVSKRAPLNEIPSEIIRWQVKSHGSVSYVQSQLVYMQDQVIKKEKNMKRKEKKGIEIPEEDKKYFDQNIISYFNLACEVNYAKF